MKISVVPALIPLGLAAVVASRRVAAQSPTISAPLADIRYEVTFTRANADKHGDGRSDAVRRVRRLLRSRREPSRPGAGAGSVVYGRREPVAGLCWCQPA